MRILKSYWVKDVSHDISESASLDWAFAGTSQTNPIVNETNESPNRYHSVWHHWIDSNGDDASPDEGDMTPLEDGTLLEEGVNLDANGSVISRYEELWEELPIEPASDSTEVPCVVVQAEDEARNLRGMAIKIGRWCQGMLKSDTAISIERWELKPTDDEPGLSRSDGAENSDYNSLQWTRTIKLGNQSLPCDVLCQDPKYFDSEQPITVDGVRWKVLEKSYW